MELVEENDWQQPDKATRPPKSPNDYSELVPIFYENDYLSVYEKRDISQPIAAYYSLIRQFSKTRPIPSKIPLPHPQTGRTMADRFPSIDDLDLGKISLHTRSCISD